jgi:hypothetical protein
MAREKTGEELLSSINKNTTAEEFELLFTQLTLDRVKFGHALAALHEGRADLPAPAW